MLGGGREPCCKAPLRVSHNVPPVLIHKITLRHNSCWSTNTKTNFLGRERQQGGKRMKALSDVSRPRGRATVIPQGSLYQNRTFPFFLPSKVQSIFSYFAVFLLICAKLAPKVFNRPNPSESIRYCIIKQEMCEHIDVGI